MAYHPYGPVIEEGIPDYRPNTSKYEEYWRIQVDRCLNGYEPNKTRLKISGKYYFHINFFKLRSGNKLIPPDYRDEDHIVFDLFEEARKNQKGLIIPKARERGFSYNFSSMFAHEYIFFPKSESGIGAYTEISAKGFFRKLKTGINFVHNNFRHRILINNDKELKSGYKVMINGNWVERGSLSIIYCRTMENPGIYRGERMGLFIFEEAGEFRNLRDAFMATRACFRKGDYYIGVPIIGGTSNKMSEGLEDFMDMYHNAEKYDLIPHFIKANRVYYPCYAREDSTQDEIPNLWHLSRSKRYGISDEKEAEQRLLKKRKKLYDNEDKSAYYIELQEYPLNIEECFSQMGGNNFPSEKINRQISLIMQNKGLSTQISRGTLLWDENDGGNCTKVNWHPNKEGKWCILHHPRTDYIGLDVGGIDSYDQKKALTTTSKGAQVIFRGYVNDNIPYELPVCIYVDRPEDPDEFYDGCLRTAVYYKSKQLIEYTKIGILTYFQNKNAYQYLKERPKSADVIETKMTNKYGVHMMEAQKLRLEELIFGHLKNHSEDIWFLNLLKELLKYGSVNTDIAMAYGISLMHYNDNLKLKVKKRDEDSVDSWVQKLPNHMEEADPIEEKEFLVNEW